MKNSTAPATENQMKWIVKLVDEKVITDELRTEIKRGIKTCSITKKDASRFLDELFGAPNVPVPGAITEPGFYRFEDQVYRVVKAKTNPNKLYAKLVTSTGFVYAKGAMAFLRAEHQMDVEAICHYGMSTGVCANCATLLTDPVSIHIGLGTKCGPTLMGKPAYNAARKAAEDDPKVAEALAAKDAIKALV